THYPVQLPQLEHVEATGVTVNTSVGKITFVAAYRPPRGVLQEADFDTLLDMEGRLFIGGDFNAKSAHWNSRLTNVSGRRLERAALRHGAIILGPYDPTHIPVRGQPDVLDVAILRGVDRFTTAETRTALSSDHLPVIFDIDVVGAAVRAGRPSFKNINVEHFQTEVREYLTDAPDPEEVGAEAAITSLNQALLRAAETATPGRTHRPQDRSRRLPQAIRELIVAKNHLFREWQITRQPETKRRVNRMRRAITAAVREHRNQAWADLVESLDPDDGSAWRVVRGFLRRRQRIPPLQLGQDHYCEPDAKASVLADTFEANFRPVVEDIDVAHVRLVEERLPVFLDAREEGDSIDPITAEEVALQLRSLNARR
ncbi:uncharacterized protein LOC124732409, partial [Schistocerca piceifrons]|uniref:uncharacterized protein LOC124732409 n=1 Tax=Schistocerca piceifrons TaxID=274613 RepID=UPI001F5EC093